MGRPSLSVFAMAACAGSCALACGEDATRAPGSAGTGGRSSSEEAGETGGSRSQHEAGAEPDGATSLPDAEAGAPGAPSELTLLHGVIDSPWIAFCFTRVGDGVEGAFTSGIVPAAGLEFGHSVRLQALPGVSLADDSIRPYVIAADGPDVVRGLDCAAIVERAKPPPSSTPDAATPMARDAGTPDAATDPGQDAGRDGGAESGADAAPPPIPSLRVSQLPVLPARVLREDAGYLLVASGCIGGPGVTNPSEVSICGANYAPDAPTLTETLVALSRTTKPNAVGLQFLVGTPAFGRSDLRLVPAVGGDPIPIATDVGEGAIRPVTPAFGATAFDVGRGSTVARVQVSATGSDPVYDMGWPRTLAAGELDALSNDATYTLVLIGPSPGFSAQHWWNAPLVTVVRNDH